MQGKTAIQRPSFADGKRNIKKKKDTKAQTAAFHRGARRLCNKHAVDKKDEIGIEKGAKGVD